MRLIVHDEYYSVADFHMWVRPLCSVLYRVGKPFAMTLCMCTCVADVYSMIVTLPAIRCPMKGIIISCEKLMIMIRQCKILGIDTN